METLEPRNKLTTPCARQALSLQWWPAAAQHLESHCTDCKVSQRWQILCRNNTTQHQHYIQVYMLFNNGTTTVRQSTKPDRVLS
jgi:hypothetical protein